MRKLRHAIGYLTEEVLYQRNSAAIADENIHANLILMACNREIYLECPLVPTLSERLRAMVPSFLERSNSSAEKAEVR
jgi:hypothetical protein